MKQAYGKKSGVTRSAMLHFCPTKIRRQVDLEEDLIFNNETGRLCEMLLGTNRLATWC